MKVASSAASSQSVLRIGFTQVLESLNPFIGTSDPARVFCGLVYDSLEVVDNKMNPSPDLATSTWIVPLIDLELKATHEPYGSVWQYNLTHNATWTDGHPFSADDVVWNINFNAGNYTTMWAYQPYSYFIKYAEKIDNYTVRIHYYDRRTGLPMPAAFGYLLSIPMLPKHLLEPLGPAYININWSGVFSNQPVPIVGTGPFMATSTIYSDWIHGNKITLVRNPNSHWSLDYGKTIHFDEIELVFFSNDSSMSAALRNGEIDIAQFSPQTFLQIQQAVASGELKNVVTYTGPKISQHWTEVGVNMYASEGNKARLDPAVRYALAMATNKSYICQQFYLGMAMPGSTLIPPINVYWHYNLTAAEMFPLNYTLANETLENAGYEWNSAHSVRVATTSSPAVKDYGVTNGTPLTFDILVNGNLPEEISIAHYLATQWAMIGIQLILDIGPHFYMGPYEPQDDLMVGYWSADLDPNYQLFVQTSSTIYGWNDNHYSNPAYDRNYTNSVMTMNREQRKVYVDNCQLINYEDAGYIILAYENQTYAWRNDTFTGWGNWATDPGRSVDNFWTGNPLYFDLVPTVASTNAEVTWLVIGSGIAVIAVMAIAAVLLMRRGKKKPKEDNDSLAGQ